MLKFLDGHASYLKIWAFGDVLSSAIPLDESGVSTFFLIGIFSTNHIILSYFFGVMCLLNCLHDTCRIKKNLMLSFELPPPTYTTTYQFIVPIQKRWEEKKLRPTIKEFLNYFEFFLR